MFKFETLIVNVIFYKHFEFGVSWCTSCHMTEQNLNFTKTLFSQSVLKIETSRFDKKKKRKNSCEYFDSHFPAKYRTSGHVTL